MMSWSWFVIIFAIIFLGQSFESAATDTEFCSDANLQQCARNADALLKDPSLVFPDSQNSVDRVCSIWSELTSCIQNFTKRCLTREQKSDFDRGFQEPVTSMRTLCQDKAYRKEYLRSAPCVKKVLTENNYCGNQYRFLIDHVSGSTSSMKQICCARAKFRNCILSVTPEKCDHSKNGANSGRNLIEEYQNATAFALTTLDKSLAFVAQQCSLTSFREEDCPGINISTRSNSKGPLHPKQSELETAASGEQLQSTEFKLGQRSPQQNNISTSTRKPTTTKKIEEKPKTDKLSSPSEKKDNNPEKNSSSSLHHLFEASFLGIPLTFILACFMPNAL